MTPSHLPNSKQRKLATGIRAKVSLVALRNLKKGEEITIDYSTIEGDPLWKMACACETKQCRQIIKSIQFLPERQYRRLTPHIPTYFRNLYIYPQQFRPA